MKRTDTRKSATTPHLSADGAPADTSADGRRSAMSVEECRRYLRGMALSDKEVEVVRDALYTLVRKVFDELVPW